MMLTETPTETPLNGRIDRLTPRGCPSMVGGASTDARVKTVAGLLVTLAADVREAHRERAMNERLREMMSQYDDVVDGPPV
jgi:hypothetical protein